MSTFDPTRLYSTLLNTGLQVKDNALYQVIHDLIAALATVNKQTNTLAASSPSVTNITTVLQQLAESTDFGIEEFQVINNSSVTNVVNNVNNTIQQIIGDSSSDFSTTDEIQIPGPIGPPGPIVPYHIGINETFFVPLYKQALFAMNIDNEGIIEVEGFLIEVDGIITTGSWTPTDGSGAGLSFITPVGTYIKIGQEVFVTCSLVYPVTADGSNMQINGLPFTCNAVGAGLANGYVNTGFSVMILVRGSTTHIEMFGVSSGINLTNAQMSFVSVFISGTYQAA